MEDYLRHQTGSGVVLDPRVEEVLPLRISIRIELLDELGPPIQVEDDELFQLIEPFLM